jgi:hypothetical protein
MKKGPSPFFVIGGLGSLTTGRWSVRAAFPRWSVGTIKVFLEKGASLFAVEIRGDNEGKIPFFRFL